MSARGPLRRLHRLGRLSASFLSFSVASSALLVSSPGVGQDCPVGGVLDEERAYFDTTLSPNVCDRSGERCESIHFFSRQTRGTAVCQDGRWRPLEPGGGSSSCPRFVFSDDEVWMAGDYLPNECKPSGARCEAAFFQTLPDGGAGYRPVTCRDGRWRPLLEESGGPTEGSASRLRPASSRDVLGSVLKQGLRRIYGGQEPYLYGPWDPVLEAGPASPGGDGGDVDLPVSDTNVQEAGVDEEDRVKSDGRTLFVLANGQSLREEAAGIPGPSTQRVRALAMDPDEAAVEPLGDFAVPLEEGQRAQGLYLRPKADQLIVTASNLHLGWGYWYSPLAWLDARSTIASLDVSDPSSPVIGPALTFDGSIVSSRRIGDVLYLATRFQPRIVGLEPFGPEGPAAAAALERIEGAELEQLLPSYRRVPGDSRLLVDPESCLLPPEDSPIRGSDVIALVAIDLDVMDVVSSACFVGATETLYASLGSIYLASSRHDYHLVPGPVGLPWADFGTASVETDLHKFSLADGKVSYVASGAVDGHLGFDVLRRPFRLSERGLDLRVVSVTGELTPDRSPVALTVLREEGGELVVLSRLPNARRPEPIGKPGEELYATRFVGDRAYLVTFLITDPLYVVDLSDPEDPVVAGELEITGFSDYLHPLDGGYLIGVGKDAIPDPFGDFRGAWYQGVKLSLFDVRDPSNPTEIDSVLLGKRGSETPVLQDHRAFTFLPLDGARPRVALGVRIHEGPPSGPGGSPSQFYDWSHSGLFLFEVDTEGGRLVSRGEMRVEEQAPSGGLWPIWGEDRSVLAGDGVFYVHGDDVYSGFWSNPADFDGPN